MLRQKWPSFKWAGRSTKFWPYAEILGLLSFEVAPYKNRLRNHINPIFISKFHLCILAFYVTACRKKNCDGYLVYIIKRKTDFKEGN